MEPLLPPAINVHHSLFPRFLLVSLGILMVTNMLYIDSIVLLPTQKTVTSPVETSPSPSYTSVVTKPDVCPQSCLTQIDKVTSAVRLSLPPTPTSAPVIASIPAAGTKEFFISFGGGSNMSDDWQDVTGLTATVDSTNYAQIKKVTFEASVHIPAANERAFVRLFNATDKHPVWFSEVTLEGGDTKLMVSPAITLDSGEKTYQVQMKTSLKYQAVLDQSRLHIVTY